MSRRKLLLKRSKRFRLLPKNLFIFLTITRNNSYINFLNKKGKLFTSVSGGYICKVVRMSRRFRKKKELISLLALKARILLKFNQIFKITMIFRGGLKWLYRFFFKKLIYKLSFFKIQLGYKTSWPHGGCRGLGKRNIKKPKRKKFFFTKFKKVKRLQKFFIKAKRAGKPLRFFLNKYTLKRMKYKKKRKK